MNIASQIVVLIVGVLHVFFMTIEMFLWTTPFGMKRFQMTQSLANDTAVLAANQGLYNGLLAAGIFASFFFKNPEVAFSFQVFFMGIIVIAGIYGAITASKRILYIQTIPALIAFLLLVFQ